MTDLDFFIPALSKSSILASSSSNASAHLLHFHLKSLFTVGHLNELRSQKSQGRIRRETLSDLGKRHNRSVQTFLSAFYNSLYVFDRKFASFPSYSDGHLRFTRRLLLPLNIEYVDEQSFK